LSGSSTGFVPSIAGWSWVAKPHAPPASSL